MKRASTIAATLVLVAGAAIRPAAALPTMVRLGYTNCASCHLAPQGGGLLNGYGRGIDEAQSLRASEVETPGAGRLLQDVRWITLEQITSSTGQPWTGLLRARLMYRNAFDLGNGFRVSSILSFENVSAPRPSLSYEPSINPATLYDSGNMSLRGYVTNALISKRVTENVEVSAGRDQLPTGVNIADLSAFVRSRNRAGYYDAPSQVKLWWGGKRFQVMPYVFGPGGNEPKDAHETGGGSLAELDLLGKGRTIVGTNVLEGQDRNEHRTLVGPYVRLGFGRWGVLGEHDITTRTAPLSSTKAFRQTASYGQVFWATREWLVLSLIAERLQVESPFPENLLAGRFETAARLSSNFTVTGSARIQRNVITGKVGPSATVQIAMKPVFRPVW